MKIPSTISDKIINAEAKALATYGSQGINVIPVSTVKIFDDKIVLVNYFMNKTVKNITGSVDSDVALSCWSGFDGIQIKARAEYQTHGDMFDDIQRWARDAFPDRTVQGIIVLTPVSIFNVSPSSDNPGGEITSQ